MNRPFATLLLANSVLLFAGCSSYPPHGQGGMAEQTLSSDFSPVMPDEPLGPEHGLRFDWQLTKLHLDMLIQEGAKWCFPASVLQLNIRQQRIARELEGGLQLDAANDIAIQRKSLAKLEQQLDYVTQQTECLPPNRQDSGRITQIEAITSVVELLNADNQFAHNSAEINPKYMGHLAQAALILKQHPDLTLAVTGHTDADGPLAFNEKLALDRANQVKRYLIIFGLQPERIVTHSLGERLPLFEGSSPGIMLTNRRVSIEVNALASSAKPHTNSGDFQ
ncbi:OmpA family protein [Vibrio fluvialis]|nr:OmpA family protein [Vibrio fluvialis]